MKKNSKISHILEELSSAKSVVIATHKGPDGDAAGSSLALGLVLRALGKNVEIAIDCGDVGAPSILDGMDTLTKPCAISFVPDIFVCLDCANEDRISNDCLIDKVGKWRTINIDHHGGNSFFGDLNYVLDDYSSTGEIIFNFIRKAGWRITREVAEALWTAITTDTGRFAYSCTRPSTLRAGAVLLSHGVRTQFLNDELFCLQSANVVKIRKRAMNSLGTWCGGLVSFITLDSADYIETGCRKADTEDFVDIPRSVRGSKIAIFFYRSFDVDQTHLSIRGRDGYSAVDIAKAFGGGGHFAAAGAMLNTSLADACDSVKTYLEAKFQ